MDAKAFPHFNPDMMLATKEEIVFNQDMEFLYLDMKSDDIPTNSMFQAKQYTQDIYDLLVFIHRIFSNHNIPSYLYLLQREQPVPGGKIMRYGNGDGYILLAAFSKEEFEAHFPTICRGAIALNVGFKTKNTMNNPETTLEDMAKMLLSLNAREGTFYGSEGKPKEPVGKFKVISDLDRSIEEYHSYTLYDEDGTKRRRVCTDKSEADSNEMWLERARLISWEYYLKQSDRMTNSRQSLLSLGKLLQTNRDTFGSSLNTMECLNKMAKEADGDHPLTDMFRMHVAWMNWDCNVRKNMTGDTILDLKKRIAWDISDYIYNFYNNRFFVIHVDEDAINKVASEKDQDISEMNEEEWLTLQKDVLTLFCERIENGMRKRVREEAESLYPVLDKLSKTIYKPVADSLGSKGKVCRLYQDPAFRSFFGERYRTLLMSANSAIMSKARREQYDTIATLTAPSMYSSGYMNTLTDTEGHRRLLVFSQDRQNVDPLQDAMANHFIRIAQISGVRQMSIELFIMLLANIWSFTPIENKPIVVLDGAPGSGKSNCALIAKVISGWKNYHAARLENYATSRSQTVPEEGERYSCVLGTRIINEWASENMTHDTSTDATIMKNLYDSGICTSQRACKNKSERGTESFRKIYEVSLDNRTMVILANGFEACWSIKDRSLIYNVPALNVSVNSCSLKEKEEELENAAIPSHFALIRYLISEQINRDSLNLTLKASDSQKMLPTYETDLTLERVSSVLTEMGFSENNMTQRKKDNISRFALILANYRATFEVYGSVWKSVYLRRPNSDETLEDYNDYLVKLMANSMRRKKQDERDLMLAQRVVVDPSDIITASTLLLQLDRVEENLLKVITFHMTSFDQTYQSDHNTYFIIENVTLARLHKEMKSHGHGVLLESLKQRLGILEDKARLESVPNFKLYYDNTGINKNREKNEKLFSMYVHTEFAAKLFMAEEKEKVEECITTVTKHIIKIIAGKEVYKSYKFANQFDPKEGITRWFKGHMAMQVPEHLKRAFGFLSYLPGKDKYIFYGSPEFGIHPDFARCRTRALQNILLEKFDRSLTKNENLPTFSFQDKYLSVETRTAKSFDRRLPGLPEERNALVMPLVVRREVEEEEEGLSIQVHVDIFSSRFDDIYGIIEMRKQIVEKCIVTGEMATDNYFLLTDYNLCKKLQMNKHIMEATVINTNVPNVLGESEYIYLTASLLNKIAPFVTNKKSTTQMFVEKCLCENMTDFQSVMVFDRELIYRTQREEDAISFVNVSEVAESLPGGKLPEWETSCVAEVKYNANKDVYDEVLSSITVMKKENKMFTFKPGHRNTQLALKFLYSRNMINKLIKHTDKEAASRSERKYMFTEKLTNLISYTIQHDLKDICYPLLQKNEKLACDVYHGKHPFLRMCISPNKRSAEGCTEPKGKRPCI